MEIKFEKTLLAVGNTRSIILTFPIEFVKLVNLKPGEVVGIESNGDYETIILTRMKKEEQNEQEQSTEGRVFESESKQGSGQEQSA